MGKKEDVPPPSEETVRGLSSRSGITITKAVGGGPKTTKSCGYWGGVLNSPDTL